MKSRGLSVGKKKSVGRPAAFEGGTRQVKLPEDLVQMVQWLARVERRTAAQIIDPLARPEVEARYARRFDDIQAIKAAEDAAALASGQPAGPDIPTPEWKGDKPIAAVLQSDPLFVEFPDLVQVANDLIAFVDDLVAERKPNTEEELEALLESEIVNTMTVQFFRLYRERMIERGRRLQTKYPTTNEVEATANPSQPNLSKKKPKK